MSAPAGYSGTPLWKKLGLKDGMTACALNAPEAYQALLAGQPDVFWGDQDAGQTFTHIFATDRARLNAAIEATLPLMARDGMIWASWPKKASKVSTNITEDVIREIALPLGLVDVKVCAVDDTWSALKLVIRKELR